jgi:hypothetical protein
MYKQSGNISKKIRNLKEKPKTKPPLEVESKIIEVKIQ